MRPRWRWQTCALDQGLATVTERQFSLERAVKTQFAGGTQLVDLDLTVKSPLFGLLSVELVLGGQEAQVRCSHALARSLPGRGEPLGLG
jgi:hypothetical protein